MHISKKPVYNPRPRSGAGRKPSASKGLAGEKQEVEMHRDELERMPGEGGLPGFSPSMEQEQSIMAASFEETVVGHRTLHEAEAEAEHAM